MYSVEHQQGIVVTARYGCDSRSASRLAAEMEELSLKRMVPFSIRNKVRQELKAQGHRLPPRTR